MLRKIFSTPRLLVPILAAPPCLVLILALLKPPTTPPATPPNSD